MKKLKMEGVDMDGMNRNCHDENAVCVIAQLAFFLPARSKLSRSLVIGPLKLMKHFSSDLSPTL